MKNRVFLGLIALVISFFLAGCEINVPDQEYNLDKFKITLEEGLKEQETESYPIYLQGLDMEFFALDESFDSLNVLGITSDSSNEDYLNVVITANNLDTEVKEKDGVSYIIYEKELNGRKYFYLATSHKSSDSFYLTQYATLSKNKEKYESKFLTWDKTLKFN